MESPTYQGTVIAQRGLYIRSIPSLTGNVPNGGLAYGSKVAADRKQDGWWRLTRINGAGETQESWAYEGSNNSYIRAEAALVTPPPTGRTFAYVYRNFERPGIGVSRPTQNGSALKVGGLPDTVKLLECRWIPLTRSMQEFWFAQLVQSAGGSMTFKELKSAWASLTCGWRAYTNRHGWDNGYADYINGVNTNRSPMGFEPILTGGNVVEILDTAPITKYGQKYWKIRTIDATNFNITAAEVNRRTDPYVITLATNSCRRGFDQNKKKWMIEKVEEPFPQLNGRDVPVPLFSDKSYNYIEASRVRIMRPGEPIPRPYYP
jgi:hypothetical protein